MWLKDSNMFFSEIENFFNGEIQERSFSNPYPWAHHISSHSEQKQNQSSSVTPCPSDSPFLAQFQYKK